MSLKIRLSRVGARKRPHYRIVVADSRSPRDGRFIETLGTYSPLLANDNPERVRVNDERAKYWLGHGAQASERVAALLAGAQVMEPPARRERPKKSEPKAKAKERMAAQEEARAKAAAAAAEAAESTGAAETTEAEGAAESGA